MSRNKERDAKEIEARKKQILEAGFELFAEKGIEAVSLQAVADAAGVGVATIYNYFSTKLNLVIYMSAKIWEMVLKEELKDFPFEKLHQMNAHQLIGFYIDCIIRLYQEHPKVFVFSANYKTFVCREGASQEQLDTHLSVLKPLEELFHLKYEEAKENGCIRTDVPEETMYRSLVLTPLCMAERYAQGIVWADDHSQMHVKEMEQLKEMILLWCSPK